MRADTARWVGVDSLQPSPHAANLGDDADTTAAIAGQLAGAMHGASGIPPEWLAMRRRIESLADALHRAAVGQRLLWEHDEYFHGWWADAEGRVPGGEYPGDRDDEDTTLIDFHSWRRLASARSSI